MNLFQKLWRLWTFGRLVTKQQRAILALYDAEIQLAQMHNWPDERALRVGKIQQLQASGTVLIQCELEALNPRNTMNNTIGR